MNRKILFTFCGSLLFAALCGCMAQTNEPVETVTIDPDIEMIDIDTETDGFTYYDLDVQEEIQSQIDAFKSETHTMEDPLLIFDPYGTNTTSLYIWFEEEEASVLSYTIQCEGYENFSRTLYSDSEDNISTAHEHQLIGLVPGETNTITLSAANSNGTLLEQVEFTVEAPQLSSGYPTQIEKSTENDAELTDGLYMTFGLNYSYDGYSFLIDNDGTVRGELPLGGDMIENVMFYNDTMFYSVNLSKAVRVDRFPFTVGRYECDLLLDAPTVSKKHLSLLQQNGTFYVQDENSSNYTYLDGQVIPPYTPVPLPASCELRLGSVVLLVKAE